MFFARDGRELGDGKMRQREPATGCCLTWRPVVVSRTADGAAQTCIDIHCCPSQSIVRSMMRLGCRSISFMHELGVLITVGRLAIAHPLLCDHGFIS